MSFDRPIPGQTPIDDVSGLRIKSIRTTAALNAAEAENIRKAVVKYLAAKPVERSARFDLAWLRRLHKEMLGDVWTWAGAFRTRELNIGSAPHQIGVELQSLLDDLHAWREHTMPLIEQGVRLHHVAVRIHPFLNGNGRWARLLANIWLRRNDGPVVEWPETTIGTTSTIRDDYLSAIRGADKGDLARLIAMHERYSAR